MNLLFFRAPPFSGKTGFAQLLCQLLLQDCNRSVVFLRCNKLAESESISSLFEKTTNSTFDMFLERKEERVIILDEAQCSYTDISFWKTVVKNTLGNEFKGLRLVILSSFGSFNPYRQSLRDGTPIEVPCGNTFGLFESPSKVGLKLLRDEFNEMVDGSHFEDSKEIMWPLCSDHIGIASSLLRFLSDSFHGITPTVSSVQAALYSNKLLSDFTHRRGMPTLSSFNKIIQSYKLESEIAIIERMKAFMDRIASGKMLKASDDTRSPGSIDAIALLIKYGFLFEDITGYLHFASQMHLKVWLYSNREHKIEHFPSCTLEAFIIMAIKRMHSSRLVKYNQQNSNDGVRERQIQMELYSSIVSLLPHDYYCTPEWRTSDKKGYIDLVIQMGNILWFLELLVDGIGAQEHSQRFKDDGKYEPSLVPGSKYALIDFRQNIRPKRLKKDFLYVCFSDSFSTAKIKTPDRDDQEIDLLS